MKHFYLLLLALLSSFAQTALAQVTTLNPDRTITAKAKKIPSVKIADNTSSAARLAAPARITSTKLAYCPLAYYVDNPDGPDEYYLALTSVDASYDEQENQLVLSGPGIILYLDLYGNNNGTESHPVLLSSGDFMKADTHKNYTYDPQYTFVSEVTELGSYQMEIDGGYLTTKRNASTNAYTITAKYLDKSESKEAKATDLQINWRQAADETGGHILPQMNRDIIADFNDAIGAYHGNLYQAGTGNMLVNLYTGDHDQETGYLTGEGFLVQLCLFNRLFTDPAMATLTPGTYKKAMNFAKYTYYPGTELTYGGTTLMLGCQAEYRDPQGNYTYCVITDGKAEIEENPDATYTVVIDMTTDDGHVVKGSFTGPVSVVDFSDDKTHTPVSTLDHDVAMNLEQIPVARLYCLDEIASDEGQLFSDFILDIGSRGGLDECINQNGGDIIRMEFLTDTQWKNMIPDGEYSVLPFDYNTIYQENTLRPGYFYNGGELSGTDYQHMQEGGAFLVMDEMAPIVEGTVKIQTNADDTHTVTMDFIDDAGFIIAGSWTGPIQLMTTYYEGIETPALTTDTTLYDLQGRRIARPTSGLYIQNGKVSVR